MRPPRLLRLVLALILVFNAATVAVAQSGNPALRTAPFGGTTEGFPTTTQINANRQGLDVNIVGGGAAGGTSSNFAAAFPATGTAAGARDTGGNMQSLTLDGLGVGANLQVNCKVGCTAAGDTTTPSGNINLGSGNGSTYPNGPAPMGLALAGDRGAAFLLAGAGTLVATIVPECSPDGGTTWFAGYFQDPVTGAVTTSQTVASAQAATLYQAMCPQGSSHARLRASAFTSGSGAFTGRATVVTLPGIAWGLVTTTAPTYTTGQINGLSLTTSGALRVGVFNGANQMPSGDVAGRPVFVEVTDGVHSVNIDPNGNLNFDLQQVVGTAAVTGGVAGLLAVGGPAASGAATSGNPVRAGANFNTTQPTVTTGQTVDLQATARGGLIVATGVDAFNAAVTGTVTANQGGTWTVQPGNTQNTTAWKTTDAADGTTGSAVPGTAIFIGGKGSGNLTPPVVCDNWTPISLTANTQIITGSATKQTHICSINLVVGAATNVALVEGTGVICGTGTAGMAGGTTAATGWNFAANGGLTQGSGIGAIARTATAADNVCILVSAANQVSGVISWTQQ